KIKLKEAVDQVVAEFDKKKEALDKRYNDDAHLDFFVSLFEGRTGSPFGVDQLDELEKIGQVRYEKKVPPGNEDAKKPENKFGDFIVWRQLMDEARRIEKPLIFITDDGKDDFWRRPNGRTIGPRHELIAEFKRETGQNLYMYNSSSFMKYAESHIG